MAKLNAIGQYCGEKNIQQIRSAHAYGGNIKLAEGNIH
jgi:hypothetical protein